MGRSHRVFVVVENRQDEHKAIVIEVVAMIRVYEVTILFDSKAIDSFISPFVVEHCRLVVGRQDVD